MFDKTGWLVGEVDDKVKMWSKTTTKLMIFFTSLKTVKKSYLLKGEFSGTSIAYIYPGMKMAIRGKFKDEKLGL